MATSSSTKVPATITTALVVVSVVFLVLSFVTIALRFWARRRSRDTYRWDDWWAVIAWISALGMSIDAWVFSGIAGVNHYKISALEGTAKSIEYIEISTLLLQVAVTTVKISILLLYKRIFVTRKFKIAAWIMIGIVTVWGILLFFLVLFQSSPVNAAWTGKGRLVLDSTALALAQVGSSIALDVIILTFPLPMIFKLQLSLKRKIQISLIFWLGAFCCASAIVRLVFVDEALRTVQNSTGYDQISLLTNDMIFQVLEANCSIIAACLPTLAPLLPRGRAMESLVRRVKSFTSLSSRKSSSTANSNDLASNEKSVRSDTSPEPRRQDNSMEYDNFPEQKDHEDVPPAVETGRISVTREVHVRSV